jgi:predicted amidophosphoribosyltransferase
MNAASWAADFADLLLPAECISCGIWVPGSASSPLVCARCRIRLKAAPWPGCGRCHFPSGTGRTGASASQTSLHPTERSANVAGAFARAAGVRAVLESAHVLLIDDVLTT